MSRLINEVRSVSVVIEFKDGYQSPAARAFIEDHQYDSNCTPTSNALNAAFERCIELTRRDTK